MPPSFVDLIRKPALSCIPSKARRSSSAARSLSLAKLLCLAAYCPSRCSASVSSYFGSASACCVPILPPAAQLRAATAPAFEVTALSDLARSTYHSGTPQRHQPAGGGRRGALEGRDGGGLRFSEADGRVRSPMTYVPQPLIGSRSPSSHPITSGSAASAHTAERLARTYLRGLVEVARSTRCAVRTRSDRDHARPAGWSSPRPAPAGRLRL